MCPGLMGGVCPPSQASVAATDTRGTDAGVLSAAVTVVGW